MLSIVSQNQPLTMSSREIARLTDSNHSNTLKTIRNLISEGVVFGNETQYKHDQNGQSYPEFHLDYRNTMVVVSGYSAKLRAAIIDRWQELEERSSKPDWLLSLSPEAQIAISDLAKQRDEALKNKAQINDKRTATLMNKASQDAKRIKKLENQLQDAGEYQSLIAAGLPQRTETEVNPKAQTWRILLKICESLGYPPKKVVDPRYGTVNTYHVSVITKYKEDYLF